MPKEVWGMTPSGSSRRHVMLAEARVGWSPSSRSMKSPHGGRAAQMLTGTGSVLILGNPDSNLVIERSRIPADAGFRVCWFTWWRPGTRKLATAPWISHVFVSPQIRRGARPLSLLKLRLVFAALQPCVAHVHYALWSAPQAQWMAHLRPLIVTAMGSDIAPSGGLRGDLRESTRYLLDNADVITSKSEFMDRELLAIGPYEKKIRRVTWGMDPDTFRPGLDARELRRKLRIADEDFVFFCARVCDERTQKEVVLRSFADLVKSDGGSATLVVSLYLGDAKIARRLVELADQLGVAERVRFVPEIRMAEMPTYFNLADAVVSVPRLDGMPQTLYQAMACGCYPIISDIPQTRELLDLGCAASVANVGDVESLREQMSCVIGNRDQIHSAGLANRELAVRIASKAEQDGAVLAIYRELLACGGYGARR